MSGFGRRSAVVQFLRSIVVQFLRNWPRCRALHVRAPAGAQVSEKLAYRRRAIVAVGALAVLSAATWLHSAAPAKWVWVNPVNKAAVRGPNLDIIARGAESPLMVDGKPQPWGLAAAPVLWAQLELDPGKHEIRVGDQTCEVFVSSTDVKAPDGWTKLKHHPMDGEGQERCAACHETKADGERFSVGRLKSHEACFKCHKSKEFVAIHNHPLEPIQHCQICHQPHGAAHKGLLKQPAKKLCADCHDVQ